MATLSRRFFQQFAAGLPRGLQFRSIVTSFSPVLTSTQPTEEISESSRDDDVVAMRMKNVLQHPDYFKVAELFTVEDLFNARVHLGHRKGSLNSHMKQFIFGSRLDHLIIDLDQTAVLLREALNFTAHIAFLGGIVLFIGRIPQHQYMIETTAKECGEYSHVRFWQDGTLTNSVVEFGCVTRLPDLLIFLHTMDNVIHQHTAVREAAKMLIPTVGIVDTNCTPNLITYPIPGNDDTSASINLFCNLFKSAILRGKEKRKEHLGL